MTLSLVDPATPPTDGRYTVFDLAEAALESAVTVRLVSEAEESRVLTRQARGGRSRGPAEDCRRLSLLGLYAADLWATLRAATEGGLPSLGRQRRPCQPRLHLLTNSNSCLTNSKTTHTCRAQSAALDQAAHMGARTRTPVLGSPRIPTRDARPLGTRAAEAWHAALARSKCCPVALPRLRKAVWFATNPRAPREAAQAVFAPPAPDLQSKPFPLEIR